MTGKTKNKILIALSAVGPGLFLIGYNIGTGSVTTMARAGAQYGLTLLWAMALSCIFTYILMVAYGQVTLVSKKTALLNIKTEFKFGKPLALYIMAALIIGELLAVVGIMGIVSDLVQEGLRLVTEGVVVSKTWITLVLITMLFVMFWFGRYKAFEKILTLFVIVMALCFIVVFIMVSPDLMELAAGLVPSIPDEPGSMGLIAAMVGSTCSAAVFIMRSTVVSEKGWNIDNLKDEKRDSFVSASMMFLISGLIMAVAAGTLHLVGLKVDSTLDLINLFEPIGGKFASFLLILGIVGAGLSTVFPIVLIAPWLISDYTGRPRDIHSPMYRTLIIAGLLIAFCSIFLDRSPTILMVFSMAFQAAILPAVAIPIFILINRSGFMKEHIASTRMNIGLVAVIIFSLITTYFAIMGFL